MKTKAFYDWHPSVVTGAEEGREPDTPVQRIPMTRHVYTNREKFMQSFLNNPRPQMRYCSGRMFTRRSPKGGYELVGYGHHVLARVDSESVNFYTAYYNEVSRTVTNWVSLFGSVLSRTDGFEVTIHESETPTVGIGTMLADSAKYIEEYVGCLKEKGNNFSPVEENAVEQVEQACMEAFNELTGE
jgi:hypothetical protein